MQRRSQRDLKTLQWPGELASFLNFLEVMAVGSVLEIGTGPGGMIQHFGRVVPGQLVTVDLAGSNDATGVSNQQARVRNDVLVQEFGDRITLVEGDSHNAKTLEKVTAALTRPVDLLFLDGDDTLDGKLRDYMMYAQLVRNDGFIATHDINAAHTGVPAFWQEYLKGYTRWEFNERHHWGGIGMVRT